MATSPAPARPRRSRAALVVVTGELTPAADAAQRIASAATAHRRGPVVLADLTRSAVLAPPDPSRPTSGLAALIEVARFGPPNLAELRASVAATDRGIGLVAGLPHPLDWVAVRPATIAVVLGALRSDAALLVALVDADLEGEEDTGSVDVEERHGLARVAVASADAVTVAAAPGPVGARLAQRTVAAARSLAPEVAIGVLGAPPSDEPSAGVSPWWASAGAVVDAALAAPVHSERGAGPERVAPGDLGVAPRSLRLA